MSLAWSVDAVQEAGAAEAAAGQRVRVDDGELVALLHRAPHFGVRLVALGARLQRHLGGRQEAVVLTAHLVAREAGLRHVRRVRVAAVALDAGLADAAVARPDDAAHADALDLRHRRRVDLRQLRLEVADRVRRVLVDDDIPTAERAVADEQAVEVVVHRRDDRQREHDQAEHRHRHAGSHAVRQRVSHRHLDRRQQRPEPAPNAGKRPEDQVGVVHDDEASQRSSP